MFFVVSVLAISFFQFLNVKLIGAYDPNASFSFNEILNFSTDHTDWNRLRVTFVFSAAPVFLLIISILGFFKYNNDRIEGKLSLGSFAALWTCVIFFNFFLTILLVSFSGKLSYDWGLYQSLAVVFAWWRFHEILLIPIVIVSLISSLLFGYFIAFNFLSFSYSNRLVYKAKGRFRFYLQVFFLPFVIGSIGILTLSTGYSILLHSAMLLNLFLVFLGMMIRSESDLYGVYEKRKDILNKNPLGWHIIAIGFWVVIFFIYR